MPGLVVDAPAKVNLVLRVGQREPDGYHAILSLVTRVDVTDTLMVAAATRTSVTCPDLPGGDTLVSRALRDFHRATRHRGGFHVGIAKRIPIGAGLGGGSSDAAAALKAANRLCDYPLDDADLAAIGAGIGSDVPFFLGPPVAHVRGRGELVTAAEPLPRAAVAIAYPGRSLPTSAVYAAYAPSRPLPTSLPTPHNLDELAAMIDNDLGPSAERLEPACATLRQSLLNRGARAAAVTGSGSAVFGLFEALEEAEAATSGLGAAWAQAATLLHA